jgi:hypothetical protein
MMDRSITSSGKTLVFTAVTLAIVGTSQLALAQTAPAKQPDATTPGAAGPAKQSDATAPGAATPAKTTAEPAGDQTPGNVPAQGAAAPAGAGAEPAPPVTLAPPALPPVAQLPPPAPEASVAAPPATLEQVEEEEEYDPTIAFARQSASATSWFARTPIATTLGKGDKSVVLTLFGALTASAIHDSTRSYSESMGSTLVARSDTLDGRSGRTQLSSRSSRIGLMLESGALDGVRTTGYISFGLGSQPSSPPSTTESTYFDSPTLGLTHAYLKMQNDYVDVLAGLTYDVFGWQGYYYPATAEYFGLPNQTSSRHTQLRLSHRFGKANGPVTLEVALAAMRPAQRDSEVPDGNGGLRLAFPGWKGIGTAGVTKSVAMPLSVGVSGVMRQFKVNSFTPPPAQDSNKVKGWGVSLDGFLPIIPGKDDYDRGNRLTLTGSFAIGTGIGDLVNSRAGASFPRLPNPALAQPAPVYTGNIDDGLVTFDQKGILHSIDWRTINAGFQYYLPPTGRVFLTGNITQSYSKNIADLYPKGGAEIGILTFIARQTRYYDVNLFFDATPSVRLGASLQYTTVEYIDGNKPHNVREMLQAVYVF